MFLSAVFSSNNTVEKYFNQLGKRSKLINSEDQATYQAQFPHFVGLNKVHSFMNLEKQPFVSEDKEGKPFYAFAVGEIYSIPSGNRSLSGLFDHFCKHKTQHWEKVNGQFCLVVYSQQENKIYIINDRFGFYSSYYAVEEKKLFFSNCIKDILPLLSRVDVSELGISQLLFLEYQLKDYTLFENVHCLPPASILTYDGNKFHIASYWTPRYEANSEVKVSELADVLRLAIHRQVSGEERQGILLSGGLDSRVVAREVCQNNPDLHTFTFGEKNSQDVHYAKQVNQVLSLQNTHLPFQSAQWKKGLMLAAWQTEGGANIQHFRSLQFHPLIKQFCDFLFTGLSGDFLMGSFLKTDTFKIMNPEQLSKMFFKELQLSSNHLSRLFYSQEEFNKHKNQLHKTIYQDLSEYDQNQWGGDILNCWNLQNRQRRFILLGAATDRYCFHSRSPFYDYDLFDLTLKMQFQQRLGESLYIKALWEMMPELRNIPWQKTGLPADPNPFRNKIRRKTKQFMSKLSPSPRTEKLQKNFFSLDKLLKNSFDEKELLHCLVRTEQRWHRVLSPEAVANLVQQYFAGNDNSSVLILKLLTLHYSERLILDEKSIDELEIENK